VPFEADARCKFVVPLLQVAGWDSEPHSISEQRTNRKQVTRGQLMKSSSTSALDKSFGVSLCEPMESGKQR